VSAPAPPSTHHDALTGLPNRRLLDDRLTQALYLAQRRDAPLAVMLLALGAFAAPDDALLAQLARSLYACVRRADTVARYGAAEFALVLCDVRGEEECRTVASRVLEALAHAAPGRALHAAIGVVLYRGGAVDAEALLRNADAALYRARQGRDPLCFYR
jgi:diguanylate cyclase (GGDEF)-like protein